MRILHLLSLSLLCATSLAAQDTRAAVRHGDWITVFEESCLMVSASGSPPDVFLIFSGSPGQPDQTHVALMSDLWGDHPNLQVTGDQFVLLASALDPDTRTQIPVHHRRSDHAIVADVERERESVDLLTAAVLASATLEEPFSLYFHDGTRIATFSGHGLDAAMTAQANCILDIPPEE